MEKTLNLRLVFIITFFQVNVTTVFLMISNETTIPYSTVCSLYG